MDCHRTMQSVEYKQRLVNDFEIYQFLVTFYKIFHVQFMKLNCCHGVLHKSQSSI